MTIVVGVPGLQGPPGINWKGAWSAQTTYAEYDGVQYQGSSYIALSPSLNVAPGTAPLQWDLFAASADLSPAAQASLATALSEAAGSATQSGQSASDSEAAAVAAGQSAQSASTSAGNAQQSAQAAATALAAMSVRNYDVVVLSSNPGGVMAAVRAAQQGCKVALIARDSHIGGMATGGISNADVNQNWTKGLIRGLSDKYYRRLAGRMGVTQQKWLNTYSYSSYPSLGTREMKSMLAEYKVDVFPNEIISSITKSGLAVTSLTTRPTTKLVTPGLSTGSNGVYSTAAGTGAVYNAQVFIDATYTGDLLALANITTTIGREANATYSETHNGWQNSSNTQFAASIDPYVTPGTPASGYLPGIAEWVSAGVTAGANGTASPYVQSMCYRLFLTTSSTYGVAIPAPDNYNAQTYELLGRHAAAAGTGWTSFQNIVTLYTLMGDGRVDMNNLAPMSVDYVHPESTEYITATHERRLQIEYNMKQWLLGLIQFVKTDARIPAAVRTDAARYMFDNREFLRNGGFSPVAYVRVGRRMVGDFVLKETNLANDISVAQQFTDPVAFGYYNLDSHNCTRQLSGGFVANEGGINNAIATTAVGNYIPMRVLFPKAADCSNVLTTFCISASAAAFAAARLEPQSMMYGDAAGAIAAWSVQTGQAVQSIPYVDLVSRIDFWGTYYAGAGACLSVDGQFTDGTITAAGTWTSSTYAAPGSNIIHKSSSAAGATLTFAPNLTETGLYRVSLRYPVSTYNTRTSSLPVTVNHAGGAASLTVNQNVYGSPGDWDVIGEFTFSKGAPSTNTVVIGTDGTNSSVISALKWEKIDNNFLH